ncbi:Transketolase central region [Thermobaculum terrenum ATCC BAA-798]|uniref:Transketolase central region n=1 Tax=Thermobaculum terrenum (strain ATCC BAA-798 / CCMEE 7001 / YNP1) TaxID=525904 RepID=D1CDL0_THET1|nr:alpha-ketoacid dehydrogenase subunit beta [Thermobaculum terrenum]ACZ41016.1 Transketolase central region [Thermobaculum terrenum ATCC BAA-798]
MATKTVIQTIRDTLFEEMERDERIIILGEDVGLAGGVFGATKGLQERFGEWRVIDTPLAESAIIGTAIGAALNGLLPIPEIQFADFIHPAFDQIVNEAARIRYRSNGAWNVQMVIRCPWGGGIHGALYHSQSVEAFFTHVPGLKVVAPSTPYDVAGLLRSSIDDPDPVLFLEHKKTYRLIKGEVPEGSRFKVPIGKAKVVRQGSDVSVFAYGLMVHQSLEAANLLSNEGIEAEVIDLRTLSPLDKETILNSVAKTGKALIVHEDNITGGFGAEVAAIIASEGFEYMDGPITRLAGPDVPAIPFASTLEEAFLPNTYKIAEAIRNLAKY